MAEQNATEAGEILFETTAYELYSGVKTQIKEGVRKVIFDLGRRQLAGPVISIVLELADNALKALYKHVFFEYAIKETGLGDIPYEQWNSIFQDEIETNYARNFERVCREQGLAIIVRLSRHGESLRLEVINDGAPKSEEYDYLKKLLKDSAHSQSIYRYVDAEEQTGDGKPVETPGLGWTLIFLTLKGLGLSPHNFQFVVGKTRTTARVDFPLDVFHVGDAGKVKILEASEAKDKLVAHIFSELHLGVVVFNEKGDVLQVSRDLLDQLGMRENNVEDFPRLLKARFAEDVFSGPFSVNLVNHFENYRLKVATIDGKRELLFNISGILNRELKQVETCWQLINLTQDAGNLSEGSIFENVHLQSIIRPYIPGMILEKARDSLRHGFLHLPNEHRELSIFFLDLIGFTTTSEKLDPAKVIDLLNLSMGIAVKSIEVHHGYIDKFLGDGIMAIFIDPLEAVIAGFEIQKNFGGLNEYRKISGEEPIEMRIGINTGMVILGSVGTRKRMDWTALGDVVNTASRIEKSGEAGSVLVSQATYEKVKDHVTVRRSFSQKVKGKEQQIMLHFLQSVSYLRGGEKKLIEL
ncbi:adenylate/guanylate cyclase domain-containing protein [Turneriella parva]|uniref:Adenylate/guanylate cyclase n=1 Tax=Turneriella parva (strain ATCC BAA-1111 / DSM 21527 / NCTC 11395 / H) TaxID=869212 RepID=I4BA69_TURPD|nr:adenylate/guanylate cyclase domain-containing protein [Turneriella parva]AFM14176.1 adenylate/guanylate cyclase [Turneriella parva DSM 21527]